MNAVLSVEAMRTAQEEYGARVLTGEEMRWGIENLEITAERWKEMGLEGFANPIKLSCEDHEGGGSAFIQQWDRSEEHTSELQSLMRISYAVFCLKKKKQKKKYI